MHINFKASGSIVLTEELRDFVTSKVQKIEHLLDSSDTSSMADIELATTTRGQKTGDVYRAEINVQFAGGFVRAEAIEETMHHAVEVAVEEARRELRKSFGRKRALMRRGASKIKDFFRGFGMKE
ncbi:MAG: ribosome-associated translation inhibitor RaiA [Patescibacteria group bacterium]